ncbi:ATP-dependent DNA helicase RecG [Nocardioides sp. Kera G14]|uniref:ATP-dependent DNA helicase RecG n=1 Tax=Nocardioides sp. Kera G14 TaxID=2884264 RepID=UPI001D107D91|nr:ATP-dependent DNA helicase RecG [Nocardioides sp. Kera G14]UDY22681.1 ATP-dependent DNA helicase RecG [Nocardioides sp. Kera G14]
MITLDSPIAAVLGGNAKGEKLAKAKGLRTVGDLLGLFPRRYLPTGSLTRLDELREGDLIAAVGETTSTTTQTYTDRRTGRPAYRVEVTLRTESTRLSMTFFAKKKHVAEWQARRLAVGTRGIFLGKVGFFRDRPQLTAPQIILFGGSTTGGGDDSEAGLAAISERPLFPLYPLTAGVEAIDVLRLQGFALDTVEDPPDLLPAQLRESYDVIGLRQAYDWIHRPDEMSQVEAAERRFRFEEALLLQVVLQRRRALLRDQAAKPRIGGGDLVERFDASLPFTLTEGQREVGEEIERDLARPHPMSRLLQGEVGSGKTLVALRAMLRVVDSGGQAVLLAPTEVLAQQHYRSISAMLGDLMGGGLFGAGASVELLTGSMTKSQRTPVLSRIVTGEAGIVIGTHALLQDTVEFFDLGLVVVDEQHRFGVEQRAALADQAMAMPHTLVMTATPIPRTVAMTVFGDLEVSTLAGLPAGRAPIQTTLVPLAEHPTWEGRIWERVREEVTKGHQAYVVAPRINGTTPEQMWMEAVDIDEDGNPVLPARPLEAVEEVLARLTDGPLKGLRIAPLHGQLPADVKERTMRAFAAGEIDVLVSTTVIEVGVDVHNATAMVILDAERFGVSQLHQLRGRVGRGGLPGLCLLVTHGDAEAPGRERLEAVASTTDGFELSRIDLELRREGNILGASQSGGRSSLQNLRVLRDERTIVEARAAAASLLDDDPELQEVPLLARAVGEIERSAEADYLERS